MSERARQTAARLYAVRNEPDFETHIANALIHYGNERLKDAIRRYMDVTKPHTARDGTPNTVAIVHRVTHEWSNVLRGMREDYVRQPEETA